MGIRHWALAALLAWSVIGSARAQHVIDASHIDELDLAGHVDLLEDPGAGLDLDQARSATGYAPAAGGLTSFGFTRSAWWARVVLRNPTGQARQLILRQDYPLIDSIDVWGVRDDVVVEHVATGDRTEFDTRPLASRDFLFPLTLPARSDTTVYVRMQTDGALNIGLSLHRPVLLLDRLAGEQLAFGLYFGGFFVLIVYNLFIFLAVRDRPFLYYLLYATSYGLYFGIHTGLSFQYLWPGQPAWANTSLLVMLALTLVFGLQFTRSFLDARRLAPRLDRLAWLLQALSVAALAGAFILPYHALIVPVAYLTLLITVVILSLGTLGLLRGVVSARYFMIAWAVLLMGVLVYMFKTFGLLPHNVFTQNGFQIGSLLEMVLLSLALANRVSELNQQSRTDALTRLTNRRAFDEALGRESARCARKGAPLALLMVDIDHFKQVNDTHGHAVGDRVLRQVADLLGELVRGRDLVARYGGEEFAVLLPGLDASTAIARAEAIRAAVRARIVEPVRISVSVGVACTDQGGCEQPPGLFLAADAALYRAKCEGRDRVAAAAAAAHTLAEAG